MKLFITGSSGTLSSTIIGHLITQGHSLFCNSLSLPSDPQEGLILPDGLAEFTKDGPVDGVLHFGEDLQPSLKWHGSKGTDFYQEKIYSTKLLAEQLCKLPQKPKVFIVLSDIGFYGDREERILMETSFMGDGLHAEMCRKLEVATNAARQAGIRVVFLRVGRIVGQWYDPFIPLFLPHKKYFTGIWGKGTHYISWISAEDAVSAIDYILSKEDIYGAVNLTSPGPLSNRDFSLGLLSQPSDTKSRAIPAFVARHLFGKITSSILCASCRAAPRKLTVAGFSFQHKSLEDALAGTSSQPPAFSFEAKE